jgi:hypothetical protein
MGVGWVREELGGERGWRWSTVVMALFEVLCLAE